MSNSSTHPMSDVRARTPYAAGRFAQLFGALLAAAGFWLIGAVPGPFGWVAVVVGGIAWLLGRRQATRAWEYLPSERRPGAEPGWLTISADGVSALAIAAGLGVGAYSGIMSAAIATVLGGVGMFEATRKIRSGPKRAHLFVATVTLVLAVVVATVGVRQLLAV